MKFNLSLSLKLTLIVFSVSGLVIASMTYINIQEQSSFFEYAYSEKASALAQSLDASISSRSDLDDKQSLQNYILNFILLNKEDVLKVSINLPDENGDLKVAVSSDSDSIGKPSGGNNKHSYETDAVVNTPYHTEDSHTLTVVTPLHLSGQTVGTYEILLSMDAAYVTLDMRTQNLLVIAISSLLFLVISFIFLLRKTIVRPITEFRAAAKKIGEGDLDTKIEIKSRDELGDLASAFNDMTDDLKVFRAEIEDYSKTLEKKVEERTEELKGSQKELQRKVEALEKNKLAMLNIMSDLKKTIGDLEKAEKQINLKNIDLAKAKKELSMLNRDLEQKVRERTVELEKVLKHKDEFISQLGHDLKNPLVPITNLLPVISKKTTDPELSKYLEIINRRINYIKHLIVQILEFARLSSPTLKLELENINLHDITDQVFEDIKLAFQEKNVKIENMIDQNISINADKLKIEELISNLSTNAIKYMEQGGKITINAEEDKDFINVSIKDTGIGLDPEELDHVFEEFYKADWSRHDQNSIGLGLSICKRIVERHNGKIWAKSQGHGKGSTFYFSIPKNLKVNLEKK